MTTNRYPIVDKVKGMLTEAIEIIECFWTSGMTNILLLLLAVVVVVVLVTPADDGTVFGNHSMRPPGSSQEGTAKP